MNSNPSSDIDAILWAHGADLVKGGITFEEAKVKLIALLEEAESRGRVDVLSSMKEWADKIDRSYNDFFQEELTKIKQPTSPQEES